MPFSIWSGKQLAPLLAEVQRDKQPMKPLSIRDGWMLPSEEASRRAVSQAQKDFQRVLASWMGDVLVLRSSDLLTPRWTDEAIEDQQLAA